jgi:chromosome segregation ATPase
MDRLKENLRAHAQKAEQLSKDYDEYRRKYLDLDDRFQEVKNMEQTYRVAYQEWKTKYEELERRASQEETDLTAHRDELEEVVLYQHWKARAQQAESQLEEWAERTASLEDHNTVLEERVRHLEFNNQQLEEVRQSLKKVYQQLENSSDRPRKPKDRPEVFNLDENQLLD